MPNPIVFISYSSMDRYEALIVRDILRHSGRTVWLDVFDIRVSADLKHELGSGIGSADVMCLLLSPSSVLSPWVAEEIARAEREKAARGLRVVPVLLRPCRPPDALLGTVMLDATEGLASADVRARLTRAVVGKEAVDDATLDIALQESLGLRAKEMDAARVLPELAQSLADVRDEPIRDVQITLDHTALPRDRVLAVGLEFDPLFSQPMWFVFAHYREERTWPEGMGLEELDHSRIRFDGKRIDARLQWFDSVVPLSEEPDGSDLRDRPASFDLQMSGDTWQPNRSVSTYEGGPTVQHLAQKLELPSLAELVEKNAAFRISLLRAERGGEEEVGSDENDFDVHVVARYPSGREATLFRSTHTPLERAILKGAFLADRKNAIEREAILNLYARATSQAAEERDERRRRAAALVDSPEAELSPDERRTAAKLHYGRAGLEMYRVFNNAPPPGPARQKLHQRAVAECDVVFRLLQPLVAAENDFDDVAMAFWSASHLAQFFRATDDATNTRARAEAALSILRAAMARDPAEPAYRRWEATAVAQVAADKAGSGDRAAAAANLRQSVNAFRSLYDAWPNSARGADLETALGDAVAHASEWQLGNAAPAREWRSELTRLRKTRKELEDTARELEVPPNELYPVAGALRALRIGRGSGELNGTPGTYMQLEPPADWSKEIFSKLDRVLTRNGYEWSRLLLPGGPRRAARWKGYWERWHLDPAQQPTARKARKATKSPAGRAKQPGKRKPQSKRRPATARG